MTDLEQISSDLEFAWEHLESEFGNRLTPMLRYVAGINLQASKEDFLIACEQFDKCEINPTTATTCFYRGRKFMRDIDASFAQHLLTDRG
jgi:hypothetical protein